MYTHCCIYVYIYIYNYRTPSSARSPIRSELITYIYI